MRPAKIEVHLNLPFVFHSSCGSNKKCATSTAVTHVFSIKTLFNSRLCIRDVFFFRTKTTRRALKDDRRQSIDPHPVESSNNATDMNFPRASRTRFSRTRLSARDWKASSYIREEKFPDEFSTRLQRKVVLASVLMSFKLNFTSLDYS